MQCGSTIFNSDKLAKKGQVNNVPCIKGVYHVMLRLMDAQWSLNIALWVIMHYG